MWPLFVVLWPAAAVVFALDGILIGASDTRYLAGAMAASAAVFVPVVLVAGGLPGVWAALLVLMGARLLTTGARFAGRRWALVGALGLNPDRAHPPFAHRTCAKPSSRSPRPGVVPLAGAPCPTRRPSRPRPWG